LVDLVAEPTKKTEPRFDTSSRSLRKSSTSTKRATILNDRKGRGASAHEVFDILVSSGKEETKTPGVGVV
jgi:hypothetical protein